MSWFGSLFMVVCAFGLGVAVWVLDDRVREIGQTRSRYYARRRAIDSALGGGDVRRVVVSYVAGTARPFRVEVEGRVWGFSCGDDFVRFVDLVGDAVDDSGVLMAVAVCEGVSMLHPSLG